MSNDMGSVDVGGTSSDKPRIRSHRCLRGHSFRIKFETSKGRVVSYFKICRRCNHNEHIKMGVPS